MCFHGLRILILRDLEKVLFVGYSSAFTTVNHCVELLKNLRLVGLRFSTLSMYISLSKEIFSVWRCPENNIIGHNDGMK